MRFQEGSYRTVFSSICQDAFPTTGDDPDNGRTFIENTLSWLLQFDPAAVPASSAARPKLVLQAGPNPAIGYCDLRYTLARDNAGFARLSVLDAGGRLIRDLPRASWKPGFTRVTWDLKDNQGRRVTAGLYFARLRTTRGSATARVVVLP